MTVHAVHFEEVEDRAAAPSFASGPQIRFPVEQVVGALTAIGAILGARLVLIIAITCAAFLANAALKAKNTYANVTLGLFLGMGFVPVVALAGTRRV